MMHSSSAVETPPCVSAPAALVQGKTLPRPLEVLIRPSLSLSTHVLYWKGGCRYCPAGLGVPSPLARVPPIISPTRATEPLFWPPEKPNSSRLVTQTLPTCPTWS